MTHSRWFSFLFSTYERGGVRRYTINRELEQSLMESLLTGLVFHSSWPPEAATGRPLFLLSFLIESLASLTRLAPREPRSSNQPYPLFFYSILICEWPRVYGHDPYLMPPPVMLMTGIELIAEWHSVTRWKDCASVNGLKVSANRSVFF